MAPFEIAPHLGAYSPLGQHCSRQSSAMTPQQKHLVRLREAYEDTPQHGKPFDDWLAWLLKHWPAEYEERTTPPKHPTARLPGSRKKIAVMRRRQMNKVALYHPLDVGHQPDVSVYISVLANGSPVREGLQSESYTVVEAEDDSPDELPTPQRMIEWLRSRGVQLDLVGEPCQHCGWTYTANRDGHTYCSWCHSQRKAEQ